MGQTSFQRPILLSTLQIIRQLKSKNLIDQDFPEDVPLRPDPEGKFILVYVHPRFLKKGQN